MKAIRVVTDSASGLPGNALKEYRISVVPIPIQVGGESFKEGVDLSPEEFYKHLDGSVMPTTSSPSPGDFIQVYRELTERADEIISIHVTAKGSGTCQSARVAADALSKEIRVCVYDSNTVSMGVGFLAIEAARAALEGLSLGQIIERLDNLKSRIKAFVAIPTLKYLKKSGRLSQGQAIFGSILSIKPVIEVKDGLLKVVDKARSYPRALERVAELAQNAVSTLPSRVAVMHANSYEEALKFSEYLKRRVNIEQLIIGEVGVSLALHGGPGMIGAVLVPG